MSAENTTAVAAVKKDISTQVLAKIETFQKSGEFTLPKDYNPENALKSAYILLSDPKNNILAKCSKESVAEALLKMVVYGVSPIKKQCYFIPHGNKLQLTKSYMGTIAAAKRSKYIKDVKAYCIYEGDEVEFEYKNGNINVIDYKPDLKNIDNSKIIG